MFGRNKWKKQYDESKFDLIDMTQFRTVSFKYITSYILMYISILIAMAVFASDIYTAVILLAYDRWSSEINPAVPINISRWIFAGCIILSTILIIFEFMIAIRVSREKNISRTYTNQIARKLYSIKGYNYFCLFGKITKSRNKKEYLALFVYFSLKGWVRLIFADGPRQVINALTLYSVLKVQEEFLDTLRDIATHSHVQALVISVMLFSLVVWLFNVFQFIFALLCAIPLYVHVEKTCSGLEEYCYVRINKRIAELVKKYYERDLMELREENKRKSKQPTLPTFLKQKDSNATLVSYTSIDSKTNLLKESNSNTNLSSISSAGTINTNTQKMLDPMYDPFTKNRHYRTNIDFDQPERKIPKRFPANPVQRKAVGSVTSNNNNNNNNDYEQVPFRPTTAPPGRNLTGVSSVSKQNSKPVHSNRQNLFDQTAPSYSVRNLPKESDYGPRSRTAPPAKQQVESFPHQKSTPIGYVQSEAAYSVHNLPKPNDYAPRSKTAPLQRLPVEPIFQPVNKTTRPQEYDQVEHSYSVSNLPKPSECPIRSQTAPLSKQQIVSSYSNSSNTPKPESVINTQSSAHLLPGSGRLVSKQNEQLHILNSEPISTILSQSFDQLKPDIAFYHQEVGVSNFYGNTGHNTLSSSSPSLTQKGFSTANNYYSDDSFNMKILSNIELMQQGINQPDSSFDLSKSSSVHPPNSKNINNTNNSNLVNSFHTAQHNLGMQAPAGITVNGHFDSRSDPVESLVSNQQSHNNGTTHIISKHSVTVPPESQSKFADFSNSNKINNQLDSSNMITQFAVAPPLPLSREDFSSPSPNSSINNNIFIQPNFSSNESSNTYANIAATLDQVHSSFYNNDSTLTLLASQNQYHNHAGYIFDLYYPSEIASAPDYNTDLPLISDEVMDDVDNQKTDEKLSKTPYPDDVNDKLEILFPSGVNTVENNPVIPYPGNENNEFKEFDKNIEGILPYPTRDLVEELITSNRYSSYVLEHENGVYDAKTIINNHSYHRDSKNNNSFSNFSTEINKK